MTTTGRIWRSVVNPSLGDRLRRAFFAFTGGRPMIDEGYAFTDVVTRESVRYYRDRRGWLWLATSPWSMFRVTRQDTARLNAYLWTWRRDR